MDQSTALVLTAAVTALPATLAVVLNGRGSKARQESIEAKVTETAERGRHAREVAEARASAVATVLDDISRQVTTLNGKTLADLADAIESRRVDLIPEAERTPAEAEHVDVVPVEAKPRKRKTPPRPGAST